jgi:hypothetical protein
MWDLLEVFGFYALFAGFLWLMDFFSDPEEAFERLGRCIYAFRRGLSGQATEGTAQQSAARKVATKD